MFAIFNFKFNQIAHEVSTLSSSSLRVASKQQNKQKGIFVPANEKLYSHKELPANGSWSINRRRIVATSFVNHSLMLPTPLLKTNLSTIIVCHGHRSVMNFPCQHRCIHIISFRHYPTRPHHHFSPNFSSFSIKWALVENFCRRMWWWAVAVSQHFASTIGTIKFHCPDYGLYVIVIVVDVGGKPRDMITNFDKKTK